MVFFLNSTTREFILSLTFVVSNWYKNCQIKKIVCSKIAFIEYGVYRGISEPFEMVFKIRPKGSYFSFVIQCVKLVQFA